MRRSRPPRIVSKTACSLVRTSRDRPAASTLIVHLGNHAGGMIGSPAMPLGHRPAVVARVWTTLLLDHAIPPSLEDIPSAKRSRSPITSRTTRFYLSVGTHSRRVRFTSPAQISPSPVAVLEHLLPRRRRVLAQGAAQYPSPLTMSSRPVWAKQSRLWDPSQLLVTGAHLLLRHSQLQDIPLATIFGPRL